MPTPAEIRATRLAAGLSLRGLARLLGVSGSARVAEWEAGRRSMSSRTWELMRYKLRIHSKSK